MKSRLVFSLICLFFISFLQAQNESSEPGRFDFGKMWTFENPPKEWFKEAYNMNASDEWFDDARKSALRFASWCSASFVSPNGLIMTNHHCSRGVIAPLQKEGESFDENGFYAKTLADERKADDLYVEQLIQVADITDDVLGAIEAGMSNDDKMAAKGAAIEKIQTAYAEKEGWEGLRLQVVTYYSGGRYSLYGYKKYDDIRLVLIPEMQLGFYGGDPDNFTFPRYNLDCTFWRAYGDDGKPLNTSEHYYEFNEKGAVEDEPVFVIGNPGRTERYRTTAQLEYDRDYRYPVRLEMMRNRHALMEEEYAENPTDELLNNMFGISNTMKAFTGIQGGLKNKNLMARKAKMENEIRSEIGSLPTDYWNELDKAYDELAKHSSALTLLGPSPIKGKALNLLFALNGFEQLMATPEPAAEDLAKAKEGIIELTEGLNSDREVTYFATLLQELKDFEHPDNKFVDGILKGRTAKAAAKQILGESWFSNPKKRDKILKLSSKKLKKCDDPLFEASRLVVPKYETAVNAFRSTTPQRREWESQVANAVFKVKGTDLPPDATFTLRIADGVVKGYDYNGTTAPYKTTYYGLYDRYYSNDKEFPWSLPKAWMNPSPELLKSPLNFVSTNDIIGGNSGSAIINQNQEVVGLIFDGNIESLPGNFIFDDTSNRSVSVHSGGMIAALRYVYNADRLVKELVGK